MKRGQSALFIILSIIVLIVVSLTIYINKESISNIWEEQLSKFKKVPQEIKPFENHIKSCLKETSQTSTELVLLQGGYFEPKKKVSMESIDVAYWYDKKETYPKLNTIENEISKSTKYLLTSCIYDFDEEYKINITHSSIETLIGDEEVTSVADLRIKVNYKNLTHNINKKYTASFESDSRLLYDAAKKIIQERLFPKNNMDLTALSNTNFNVNFYSFEDSMVYSLFNNETLNFATRT